MCFTPRKAGDGAIVVHESGKDTSAYIYSLHKTIVVHASGKDTRTCTIHTQNRNHHVATLRL